MSKFDRKPISRVVISHN